MLTILHKKNGQDNDYDNVEDDFEGGGKNRRRRKR